MREPVNANSKVERNFEMDHLTLKIQNLLRMIQVYGYYPTLSYLMSGERLQFDHLYAQDVMDAIKASIVQVDQPAPDIVVHSWGDQMWAKGAAAYALDGVEALALDEMADQDA